MVGRGVPAEPAPGSRPRWWGERTREPALLTIPPLRSGAVERNQGRLIEDDWPYPARRRRLAQRWGEASLPSRHRIRDFSRQGWLASTLAPPTEA
jgi:hypothetical protein